MYFLTKLLKIIDIAYQYFFLFFSCNQISESFTKCLKNQPCDVIKMMDESRSEKKDG